jgi:ATP-dependent RNA helicase SUPV3L1/SUV3
VSCPADDWPAVLKGFGIAPAERDKETEAVTLWRYGARSRPEEGGARPARRDGGRGQGKRPEGQDGVAGAKDGAKGRPRGDRKGGQRGGPNGSHSGSGRGAPPPRGRQPDPDSPFAALAALLPPEPPPKKKRNRPKGPKRDKAQADAAKPAGEATQSASGFTYTPFR